MSYPTKEERLLSRREALKTLAAASGAAVLSTLPNKWEHPLIRVGALPAFAQPSPLTYPFTNEVNVRIERGGVEFTEATWFEDQGWVGVYIPPEGGILSVEAQDARWKKKKPWRRLKRRKIGPPFWEAGPLIVFITLTFKADHPKKKPKGKIFLYGYGKSGGTVYNGLLEGDIENGEVVIAFFLPVGFIGFFFFSAFFPVLIVLEDGDEFDATFYFGPCIYGPNSPYADDDDQDDLDDNIENPNTVTLANFRITFEGVVYNPDDTSTWTYRVEELSTPPELTKWVLALPLLEECATINSSSPPGTEVTPDSDSGLIGIQWETDPTFNEGEFTVTLSGDVAAGLVDVAAKGDDDIVRIGQIAGPICQDALDDVILPNCYRITFLEVIDNGDGTTTWRYRVGEQPCAQDLSNWVLALPLGCTTVVSASPEPWEVVTPDPNANLDGIKWQTGAGFQQGDFEVTLQGELDVDLAVGIVDVAAKGPDMAFGQINGPVCL